MIEVRQGNALAQNGIIVHGCNCLGVMGAGIALQVRLQYPAVFDEYVKEHKTNGLKLGHIQVVEVAPEKWIVNAMTQQSTGGPRPVSYDAVARCFENVNAAAEQLEQQTGKSHEIIFPQIGAGLGGGNWKIIETIIDQSVSDKFKKVLYLYKP